MKLKLLGALLCLSVTAMGQVTVKYQFNNLGTTAVDGSGMWFLNTTPAALGLQQISPSLVFEGQGWKSNATATSQSVKFMQDVLPVQGSAAATGIWRLRASINNGVYSATPIIQAFSDGTVSLASGLTIQGTRLINFTGTGASEIRNSVTATSLLFSTTFSTLAPTSGAFQFKNTNAAYTTTSGTMSEVAISGSSYAPTSGTAAFNSLMLNNTVNQTGGANGQVTWVNASPTFTAAVNATGYDWNPVTPANISGTHLAWRNTSGNVLIGGTTLTSGSVLVDMQSTTRGLLLPRVTNIASVTTPVNGMIAYDAATNLFNFRQNGAWVNLGGGGGGSPGGTANELQKNDGASGFAGNKIFSSTDGNLTLGDNALAGTYRVINTAGSGTDVGINLAVKGTNSDVRIDSDRGLSVFNASTNKRASMYFSGSEVLYECAGGDFALGIQSNDFAYAVKIYGGNGFTGNNNGGDIYFKPGGKSGTGLDGNTSFNTTPTVNFQAMQKGMYVGNASSEPTGNPTAGIFLWAFNVNSSAKLKIRDESGNVGIIPISLQGSATLNFPNTTAGTSSDLTITVTDAALSDAVVLGTPNGSVNGSSCYTAWVSAANTVTVRFNNYSSGAIDPASGTFKVTILK